MGVAVQGQLNAITAFVFGADTGRIRDNDRWFAGERKRRTRTKRAPTLTVPGIYMSATREGSAADGFARLKRKCPSNFSIALHSKGQEILRRLTCRPIVTADSFHSRRPNSRSTASSADCTCRVHWYRIEVVKVQSSARQATSPRRLGDALSNGYS